MARTAVSPSPASRRSTPRSNAGVPPARLMSPDEKIKYAAKRSAGDAGSAKQPPAAASTAFSIVGPADVAILALGVGVWLYVMLSFGVPLLSPPPAVSFVAVAAGVAPSQLLLYPLVWYNSKAFAKACKKRKWKPVPVFARLVALGKVLQQVALLAWIASLSGGSAAALYAQVLASLQWATCPALVTMGQVLNGSVYKAIGADGVYYGFNQPRAVVDRLPFLRRLPPPPVRRRLLLAARRLRALCIEGDHRGGPRAARRMVGGPVRAQLGHRGVRRQRRRVKPSRRCARELKITTRTPTRPPFVPRRRRYVHICMRPTDVRNTGATVHSCLDERPEFSRRAVGGRGRQSFLLT